MNEMTSTQQFIIAILTLAFTYLIPYVIKIIFQIKAQQLANLKIQSEQYKETIKQLCIAAEALYKDGHGEAKYKWVLDKVAPIIHLPKEQLKGLIETALIETKKALAEEWDKLGETKPPTQ